jgi:predicted nucleic acid-binding protein
LRESARGPASEKPKAVLDTNVFVAGIFWRGNARQCLLRFARREFQMFVSEPVLREYAETAWELKIEENLQQDPQPWLNWITSRATIVAPVELTQPVSSDADDDQFIEAALAARGRNSLSAEIGICSAWKSHSELRS